MMRWYKTVIACGVIILAGCAVGPDYVRPNIDVNDEICFVDIGCTQQQRNIVRSSKSMSHTSIVIDTVKLD